MCLLPLNRDEHSKVQVVCSVAHFTFKKSFESCINSNVDFKNAEKTD